MLRWKARKDMKDDFSPPVRGNEHLQKLRCWAALCCQMFVNDALKKYISMGLEVECVCVRPEK